MLYMEHQFSIFSSLVLELEMLLWKNKQKQSDYYKEYISRTQKNIRYVANTKNEHYTNS